MDWTSLRIGPESAVLKAEDSDEEAYEEIA